MAASVNPEELEAFTIFIQLYEGANRLGLANVFKYAKQFVAIRETDLSPYALTMQWQDYVLSVGRYRKEPV